MKLLPLQDRIVIEPTEVKAKTSGGLYIPENAKEKPVIGKVVAVGKGRFNDLGDRLPMELSVGKKVLYGRYAGTEVTIDDDTYLILKEPDILAVVQ